jgi:parallel beta-helix repeat protein
VINQIKLLSFSKGPMKKIITLFLFSAMNTPLSYGIDYYFSNSGNDEINTGKNQSDPFKSITKLNTLSLNPGDHIFFKRGETFNGQINLINSGTSSNYISFDVYGTGPNPIITGAVKIKDWKVYSGNMYVADVPLVNDNINQLFINKSLMTLARYPNTGYLKIDSSSGKTNLTSDALTQTDGYWQGANLIARTERWVYENKKVADFKEGTLYLTSPSAYSFKPGYGFFLNNKLSELDAAGEWYYDAQTKKVYLIAPDQQDPNNLNIEVSIYNYGFYINQQRYISINNLTICTQNLDGIFANACSNIFISNTSILSTYRNGISTGYNGGSNIRIINNSFSDIGNNGIDIGHSTFSTIQGNTLKKIALNAGMGGSGDGKYIGIIGGTDSYIGSNVLDSIGYNGIHFNSRDTVAFNIVNNTCLIKDDGAGIYCYKSNHAVIKNNIVLAVKGNGDATLKEFQTSAHGIYIDDSSSYCSLLNNTVVNADYGIFVHNAFNNTLKGNVLYNNRKAQLALQNDRNVAENVSVKENMISGNVFYSLNPDQFCMYFWTYKNTMTDFGTFDRNYYCNPYSDVLIKTISAPEYPSGTLQKSQTYRLTDWKKLIANDLYSIISKVNFGFYYKVNVLSENLISNATFKNDRNGWYSWGSKNYSISLDSTNILMSDNSLKSAFSDFSLNSKGYFANGNFPVVNGHYYKLAFKANSLKSSNLDFDITQNAYPYKFSELNSSFLIENDTNNFEYVFKSQSSFLNARVLFSTTVYDSTAWVDNVSLTEVSVDTNISMPCTNSPIIINATSATKNIRLPGTVRDLNGKTIRRSVSIPPFSSRVYTSSSYGGLFRTSADGDIISAQAISDINISPVPAQLGDHIYIQYPDGTKDIMADYSISDLAGREILKGSVSFDDSNRIEISTADLTEGFSIIKLTTKTGIKTAKIILF